MHVCVCVCVCVWVFGYVFMYMILIARGLTSFQFWDFDQLMYMTITKITNIPF